MKHAATLLPPTILNEYPIYSIEQTTPTGTYHWAKSKNHKPPTLKKITQVKYVTLVHYDDGSKKRFGYEFTVWKRGWHHIKGARKRAKRA